MSSLNRATLIGNVGNEPDIRQTQDGREIANFSVATLERWKDKDTGEQREVTEWHRIVCFNENLVRVIKSYVHKGSKIFVEGQLQTRKWTDQSGIERYSTEIVLKAFNGTITLLDKKPDDGRHNYDSHSYGREAPMPKAETGESHQTGYAPDLDDEIPF